MSTGEGFASLERFYYDSASKSCKSFAYKGLKGNQNNFLSLVRLLYLYSQTSIFPSLCQRACQLACLPLDSKLMAVMCTNPSLTVQILALGNQQNLPVAKFSSVRQPIVTLVPSIFGAIWVPSLKLPFAVPEQQILVQSH